MNFSTCDLCDEFDGKAGYALRVVDPIFRSYGGKPAFYGQIATLKVFEDNALVRERLGEPGNGRVLVIDGGGSLRCALVGDQLGALAVANGWAGLVVHGCIRDSAVIATQAIGVQALGTNPRKSVKAGIGQRDVAVDFAGTTFAPGEWLYADGDGILVAALALIQGNAE